MADSAKDRVRQEMADLNEKIEKLTGFLLTPAVHALPEAQQRLLVAQRSIMSAYAEVLELRLKLWD